MEWYLENKTINSISCCAHQYPICPSANPCPTKYACITEGGGGCSSKSCFIKW